MSDFDASPNPIIRMLLDNLTASLTQLVVKYESVAKDCERLEHNLASVAGSVHDVGEMKENLNAIRVQCESNTDILRKLSVDINDSRSDLSSLVSNAEKALAVQDEKMDSMSKQLYEVKGSLEKGFSDVLGGQTSLTEQHSNLNLAVTPISAFSKLVSRPITVALFILALLGAIWGIVEIVVKTKKAAEGATPPAKTAPAVPGKGTPTP